MRKEFKMTEQQLKVLMDASKPVMMIALQCGRPKSPQENANDAWCALGKEMGFDYMTVKPSWDKGERVFTAEPITIN